MEKVLAIADSEIESITIDCKSILTRARSLMEDLILAPPSQGSQDFELLCELVTTSRLLLATLKTVQIPENLVKNKYYKVEHFTYETIKASMMLIKSLKEDLSISGIRLNAH